MTVPTDDVEATSSSVRILLVDDNAGKRFALRAVLAPLGFRIVEADSGFAALRCLLVEDFAMILLDVCMPVMDGFETASLIRQRSRNEMTPIIFITAYTEDEIPATDRYTGGAVDFIFAPVPPDELRSKVSAFAHLYERAQELARAAREVQITADQLRLLTDAAPIGIFRTDSEGRYVHTNPRWTEITGLTPEEAAGQPWRTILAAEDRTALGDESATAGAPQGELCHRFELCAPGEASRIVLVTARAIPDGAGGSAGWVGTLADVSVEVRAEAAMSEARDAALNSSAMQRNFTASASHELRTPTTSILGFVEEVLEDVDLSEENRGHLLIVLRNAERLSHLIDDLLILGQSEIGSTMMEVGPTDLRLLVQQVISSLSGTAERVGTALELDAGGDDTTALADPLRLEQALTNLIGNALKFTAGDGRVTVGIRGRGERVELTVSDTGTGIHPADVANIFERFYRTKAAIDTSVKGSGLGLAIAKKMIEAQDGTISVTSALGVGSVFTITLPACAHQPAPA